MSELPYAGEEPFAYVSYARKDRNECILAIKHLHALGYRVFYDADIEEERLRAAESMIVLVSPCACDSDEVKDEIQLANKANKDVLAIHLSEVDLYGTVGLLLDAADDVKKFRMKEAFYRQRLEKGLDADIMREGVTPPPLPKEPDKVMPPKSKKKTGAVSAKKKGAAKTESKAEPDPGGPKPPGFMEIVQNLPPKQQALYGGLAFFGIFLIGAVVIFATGGTDDVAPVAGGSATSTDDGPRDTYTAADRKADDDRRRKKREATRAAEKNREFAGNAHAAAVALLDSGKPEEAVAKCSEAIKLRPDRASFYVTRAKAYYAAKKDIDAIRDYSKAIKLEPENTSLYMARGKVRQFKDPTRAVADFGVVIEREPKNHIGWIARGDANRRKGKKADLKAAFKDYTASVKLKKTYAGYYGRALARKKLGDAKGARRDEDRARKAR
jgi:hypothetical protein